LTALSDESTQIRGLETGADDYINKPISPKVFLSKVSSLFRRLNKSEGKVIAVNGLIIDPEKFIVQYNSKDISLAKKEFELLYLLASKPEEYL
jgi:two-component system alkaline phosphatase synthesis response regulator PhoP